MTIYKSIKKILINLSILFSISLFMIFVVEFFFRLIDKPGWDHAIEAGWKYSGDDRAVNQLGYRGQEIKYSDNDIVILLLSDSQVEAGTCAFENLPEQLLEKHLRKKDPRFRVFSLGSNGYGNDQEYLAIKSYFKKYRADAVFLWQTFDNDVWNNIFPTHFPKDGVVKPTFWLENGILKGPNYRLGEHIKDPAKTKIGVLINRFIHPQRGLDASWEKYLPKPYEPLKDYKGDFLTDWDPDDKRNIYPMLKFENLENEKSHFSVYLYPRSDRMQYGLDLTKALLNKIKEEASRNKAKLFIFYTSLPGGKSSLMLNNTQDITVHKKDNLYYKTSVAQAKENQKYINEGFDVIEIPILPDWRISEKDAHLNCKANDEVMRVLSDYILKSMIF